MNAETISNIFNSFDNCEAKRLKSNRKKKLEKSKHTESASKVFILFIGRNRSEENYQRATLARQSNIRGKLSLNNIYIEKPVLL